MWGIWVGACEISNSYYRELKKYVETIKILKKEEFDIAKYLRSKWNQ